MNSIHSIFRTIMGEGGGGGGGEGDVCIQASVCMH